MHRWLASGFVLLVAGLTCLAQAQSPIAGFPPGTFQSRAALDAGGTPAYQGPGDIVAFDAWWGLRCYRAAYAGNVADVFAPSDASHTLLTCSAGGTINETVQALATTCAVSCTVGTLYDQSGGNNCSSGPCDIIKNVGQVADRPALVVSCVSSKPCISFDLTQTDFGTQNPFVATSQPFSYSTVCQRNGAFTSFQACMGYPSSGNIQLGFGNAANSLLQYAGTVQTVTTYADSAFHAMQAVFSDGDATSTLYADGTTTGTTVGTNGWGGSVGVEIGTGNNPCGCYVQEAGIKRAKINSTDAGSLNAQQHSYWGF